MGKNSDYIIFISGSEILYESELNKKSDSLVLYLIKNKAHRVIIYGHKNTYMFISIVACLKAAITYIICDLSMPKDRIEDIIQDSKADLILNTVDENIEADYVVNLEDLNKIIENKSETCEQDIDQLDNYTYEGNKNVNSKYCSDINLFFEHLNNKEIKDKTAYIVYTSGSTGKPKGIEISYGNVMNFVNWFNNLSYIKITRPSVILNQALFSFDLSVVDLFYSLTNRATLFCLTRNDIENYNQLFDIMKKSNAEMMTFTPTFLEFCLCERSFNENELKSLKVVLLCGEVLKPEITMKFRKRFESVHIINAYGPSEATCFVTAIEINDNYMKQKRLPIGNINDSACEMFIVDEQNYIVGDNKIGQIVIKGKSVSKGYINYDNDAFNLENRSFYTGDIGYIENDRLYFCGRIDRQIKYKGFRIELSDIENQLLRLSEINQVKVVAKFEHDLESKNDINYKYIYNRVLSLEAYVVCENDIDSSIIKEKLKLIVPDYMIPKNIYIVDKISVNQHYKSISLNNNF